MHDSKQMQPIKDQVAALTERMAGLRREMKICTNVAEWSNAVEVIVNRIEVGNYERKIDEQEKVKEDISIC